MAAALASSDLCVNSGETSVGDCFWSNDNSHGISVSPKQIVYMNPFVTFPQAPAFIPFAFNSADTSSSKSEDTIFTLIEIDLLPLRHQQAAAVEVMIEETLSHSLCVIITMQIAFSSLHASC
jgi:hypothetical protein